MRVWLPTGEPADITVRGLTRPQWTTLLDSHPPRDGETGWNEDTFPPALIAACTSFTAADAESWWIETPEDAAEALFAECLRQSVPGSWEWARRLLKRNPRRMAEVELCNHAGIPLSEFLTWPADDQDLALAAHEVGRDHCPGCGVPTAAMEDPEAAEVVKRPCLHCMARAAVQDDIPADQRGHVHVFVVPAGGV